MEFDAKELRAIRDAEEKISRAVARLHEQLPKWAVERIELDSDSCAHIEKFLPVPGQGTRKPPIGGRP